MLNFQLKPEPAFEVASVRAYEHPNEVIVSLAAADGGGISGDRFSDVGTLYDFVSDAYGVKLFQITGGPD
jgi:hypothetical protein